MTDQQPSTNSTSLYEKHLKILGLEDASSQKLDAATQIEQQRIEATTLPPLVLPAKKISRFHVISGGAIGLAAAAALAIILNPRPQNSNDSAAYEMKGQTQIQVFHKRGETVERLLPGQKLESGDQIRVSLTAGQSGKAFLGYFDGKNNPLITLDSVLKSGQELTAGAKTEFPGSVKLVGENIREKVVVLVCSEDGQRQVEKAGAVGIKDTLQKSLQNSASPASLIGFDCQVYAQTLR